MTKATCPHCGSFMRELLDITQPDGHITDAKVTKWLRDTANEFSDDANRDAMLSAALLIEDNPL